MHRTFTVLTFFFLRKDLTDLKRQFKEENEMKLADINKRVDSCLNSQRDLGTTVDLMGKEVMQFCFNLEYTFYLIFQKRH